MKKKEVPKLGPKVIAGYLLIVVIMAVGLYLIYRNLVEFSQSRVKNEEHRELLVVGRTLSMLYEIESVQNLFTSENAGAYFLKYDSIVPDIARNLDSLRLMTSDSFRINKLDSIRLLIDQKRDNLEKVASLLDSMRTAPQITTLMESSYVPPSLNREISNYLTSNNLAPSLSHDSDTSVVKGQRKGFLDRVRNVFVASEDSTLVIEKRSVVTSSQFRVLVDTLINKIRTSEKLNLKRHKQFELAFLSQLEVMSQHNRMLTARIDDLLKSVEQEEMKKSLALVSAREKAIRGSQQTLFIVSTLAMLIALVFVFLFLIDLNKSRRYRRELEQSHKQISNLLASREKLMLTISHDIKAPMSSILGYIELMEEEEDPEKRERFLYYMKSSGDQVLRLISTLLDYHRIESGTWQLKETRFDLHTLAEETVQGFRPLAMQKELEYSVENRIPEESIRYGDLYMIRQIMNNILSNAVKYTRSGKISVVMHEEIREHSDWFIFSVNDTGEGIDETDQQLIFGEFQRGHNHEESEPVEGSGLGLAITKGFVEALQGEIQLHSEKGEGSSFIIGLPLKTIDIEEKNREKEQPVSDNRKCCALVVDDDIVQLMMISEMLQKLAFEVVTERNPDEVIPLLKHHSFDIIFIDIMMPHTNGFTLAEKVKAVLQQSEVPLIALTARSDISLDDLHEAGFSGNLTKPFNLHDLNMLVKQYHLTNEENTHHPLITSSLHTPIGVAALIEFVKEDPIVCKSILQSFVDETSANIPLLKNYMGNNEMRAAAGLSHKMLPLFRMMDNKVVVFLLSRLEKEKTLSEKEKGEVLDLLKESVAEAVDLMKKLSLG